MGELVLISINRPGLPAAQQDSKVEQENIIKDGVGTEENVFTVENFGERKVKFLCPTKDSKVMWLVHLYQHACDQRHNFEVILIKLQFGFLENNNILLG